MQIDFIDEKNHLSKEQMTLLENVLTYTLKQENIPPSAELSISIVTNDEIKDLNGTYRSKDEATDVLSFPMIDWNEQEIETDVAEVTLLGDIVISYERMEEQAHFYGHSDERELAFLAVHGLLHLLGYTHDDEQSEKEMFEKQEQILQVFELER